MEKAEPIITKVLILVNLAVYVIAGIIGGSFLELSDEVLMLLGQFNYLVLKYGWYFQLLTAMFVHVNIVHLAFNMFWLYILGTQCELTFGARRYLAIYFVSGFFGNILTLYLLPPGTVSAGASGAVFGIFGSLMAYSGFTRRSMFASIVYAIFILVLNAGFGVNVVAHFGGLLSGFILGYVYTKRAKMLYGV
ncbi:MAG: rhomboid family intramembrane serine protease [Desulfurococcales archaeon ex4484_217_2]|nr:MAG: rhomboid family intramembrane serine protease [Desulfurococcales archaeon ex4484_217_2]